MLKANTPELFQLNLISLVSFNYPPPITISTRHLPHYVLPWCVDAAMMQVSTSTVVEKEGVVHARTSNTWKTDQNALGVTGGGVQTTLVRVNSG